MRETLKRLFVPHRSIPITIRNFFHLEAAGTVIGNYITEEDDEAGGQFVKGFATIDDVALINVEVCAPPFTSLKYSKIGVLGTSA